MKPAIHAKWVLDLGLCTAGGEATDDVTLVTCKRCRRRLDAQPQTPPYRPPRTPGAPALSRKPVEGKAWRTFDPNAPTGGRY